MVKKISYIIILFISINGTSQNFELPPNFLTAKQGFAVSIDTNKSLYLNLELEYFTNKKWSTVTGVNFFLASKNNIRSRYLN